MPMIYRINPLASRTNPHNTERQAKRSRKEGRRFRGRKVRRQEITPPNTPPPKNIMESKRHFQGDDRGSAHIFTNE